MSQVVIVLVRIFVALTGLGTLAGQLLVIPRLAGEIGTQSGLVGATVLYAVGGIALGVCLQICLAATWVLLSMAGRGAIFERNAFVWVDAIIAASLAALGLAMGFGAHAVFVLAPRLQLSGLAAVVTATVVAQATFVLLVVVLRALLRSATAMRTELAEVI